MKIKLEYPFNSKWGKGYLVTNTENRKNVILYNNPRDRTTISYARYLMSVNLKRFLKKEEQVDHIDEDKTNDVLDNLQILSIAENNKKHIKIKEKTQQQVEISCPVCKNRFIKRRGATQLVQSLFGKISCCSRKCSDIFKTKRKEYDVEFLDLLSEEQIFKQFRKDSIV